MKERPILFSGPMVRALLDGSKTQTRRAAKLTAAGHLKEVGGNRRWHPADPEAVKACPYGQRGDRLWVRETFGEDYGYCDHPEMPGCPDERWHNKWLYRADGIEAPEVEECFTGWKPSIHMPRAASRITLEVTGVRVERLQDISAEDARAEGVFTPEAAYAQNGPKAPIFGYAGLWMDINGPGSWEANPWVWVVEFRRLP